LHGKLLEAGSLTMAMVLSESEGTGLRAHAAMLLRRLAENRTTPADSLFLFFQFVTISNSIQ
jgi:hypothetical protein